MDRAEVVTALEAFFARREDVLVAYLFGSVARGEAGDASDVDVAVLRRDPPRGTLAALPLDLESELERLMGRTVQVVALELAPPDLVHRILRDGVLVCERDPSARIAFVVRARNEYWDVEPHLRRYRAAGEKRT